jgi:hypothetical protein
MQRIRSIIYFESTHSVISLLQELLSEVILINLVFGPVLGPEEGFGSKYGTHAAPL